MADNKFGSYHLANNTTDLYEIQRSNNFEFVVTNLTELLRAGEIEGVGGTIKNVSEVLRLSVVSAAVPTFTQEPIIIRRGNSVMKAAGIPTFNEGSLVINDFIGADGKSALMAWQNLSYDVRTEKVGRMKDYKKDCYLLEYTPDYQLVRQWLLKGCWVSGITMSEFNQEQGEKRTVSATIQYDSAFMQMPDDED
jgi:hypothetical protein